MAAADQGNAVAQYTLGYVYDNGDGVPQNNINVYVWWSMAKTQEQPAAVDSIDLIKEEMTLEQIAKGQALASQCYKSSHQDCY